MTKNLNTIKSMAEYREIWRLTRKSPRSRQQTNQLFDADCEIIKFNGTYLCSSVDTLGEEIAIGLYKSPYLWGWLTVMASVSDLAVTGAQPLGLLLSTEWKFKTTPKTKSEFYRGANAAMKLAGVPLLGGDAGYSTDSVLSATILGSSLQKPLTRRGVKPGDFILLTEPKKTGIGPCIAFRYLMNLPETAFPETLFKPRPKISLIPKLRPLLRASIDTSDGIATSLDIIGHLNNVSFDLYWEDSFFHPRALKFCERHHIHPLMLWMGNLGDYQGLLFVEPNNLNRVLARNPQLQVLGQCRPRKQLSSVTYSSLKMNFPLAQMKACPRDAEGILSFFKNLNHQFWETASQAPRPLASLPQGYKLFL